MLGGEVRERRAIPYHRPRRHRHERIRPCAIAGEQRIFGGHVAQLDGADVHPERACRRSRFTELVVVVIRIPEHGHARDPRRRQLQELQALRGQVRRDEADARDVAARCGERLHELAADRISARHDDDRNRLRGRLDERRHVATDREDHVRLGSHEVCGELGEPFGVALGMPVLDRKVLAFHVAVLAERLAKRAHVGIGAGVAEEQHAQARRACGPLREGRGRRQQRQRTAQHRSPCDHLRPSYLSSQVKTRRMPSP
jgi:hypothetical protein